jgi:hypothetical protein
MKGKVPVIFPAKGQPFIPTYRSMKLSSMKRRDFLYSAGAAASIPVLPLPAMAAPVASAPVHTAQVGWAALYARTHAKASPTLIQKWLGVGPKQAHALMSELARLNVLGTPVGGTAAAVKPIYATRSVPGARSTGAKIADAAKDMARTWIEDAHQENEPLTEDTDETS